MAALNSVDLINITYYYAQKVSYFIFASHKKIDNILNVVHKINCFKNQKLIINFKIIAYWQLRCSVFFPTKTTKQTA